MSTATGSAPGGRGGAWSWSAGCSRTATARPRSSPRWRCSDPCREGALRSPPSMSLLGRDTELEALAAAVRRVRGGELHAVVISGEPGIGKTSLLARAAALAEDKGLAVTSVRAVTHEREV